jgi:hypothetical protein
MGSAAVRIGAPLGAGRATDPQWTEHSLLPLLVGESSINGVPAARKTIELSSLAVRCVENVVGVGQKHAR